MKIKNLVKPLTIDKNTWCYLEGNKVSIIHEVRDEDGTYHRTITIKLPLRIIKQWFE